MKLTQSQSDLLKEVLRAKLRLWDASLKAENELDREIDVFNPEVSGFCIFLGPLEDVDRVTDEQLIEIFELEG